MRQADTAAGTRKAIKDSMRMAGDKGFQVFIEMG